MIQIAMTKNAQKITIKQSVRQLIQGGGGIGYIMNQIEDSILDAPRNVIYPIFFEIKWKKNPK